MKQPNVPQMFPNSILLFRKIVLKYIPGVEGGSSTGKKTI